MTGFTWRPGGSHTVIYEYANRLVRDGHSVTLIYPLVLSNLPQPAGADLLSPIRNQITYLRRKFTTPRPSWFDLDERVRSLSIREPLPSVIPEADVVVATSWFIAEYVRNYPDSKGIKINLIQGNETVEGKYPHDRVVATWMSLMTKIVVSKWLYEFGQDLGAMDIVHIPNGVNLETYKLTMPIANRPMRVAFAYSPKKVKDPDTAIEALRIAKDEFPELQAVFFSAAKKEKNVPEWIEYQRDPAKDTIVNDIYNGSSVYLCSSMAEGFGLPGAEAMACGCAVVSTDCGGVRDYAQHGRNSLLSSVGDPNLLANNLCSLLRNDELRIKLAKKANQDIQEFDWDSSLKSMVNLFESQL